MLLKIRWSALMVTERQDTWRVKRKGKMPLKARP